MTLVYYFMKKTYVGTAIRASRRTARSWR